MCTYVEVLNANLGMHAFEVLLGHEDALTEEVLVDLLSIGFRDEPLVSVSSVFVVLGSSVWQRT